MNAHVSYAYLVFTNAINPFVTAVTGFSPAAGTLLTRVLHGPWPESQFATVGPFELNWETQQYKCSISQWITFALLAALQTLNLFWLILILRILWRVARTFGEEKVDERSEYEGDEEEERAKELNQMKKEAKGKESVKKSA